MSGIFVQPPDLAALAVAAGERSGERVWNFPMDTDYDTELESRIADVMQCTSDSKADHILAARLLSRFVPPATPWIHMDLSAAVRSGGLAHINTDINRLWCPLHPGAAARREAAAGAQKARLNDHSHPTTTG